MADFCITKVKYNTERSHINFVSLREVKKKADGTATLGQPRTVPRAFVADLIRLGKASFATAVEKADQPGFTLGADVHVIEDIYITTTPNDRKRDNLGNLPEL